MTAFSLIEVTARFNPRGEPRPSSLVWEGQNLNVRELGRRWAEEDGLHLLARVQDGRVFELVYNALIWRGKVVSQAPDFS